MRTPELGDQASVYSYRGAPSFLESLQALILENKHSTASPPYPVSCLLLSSRRLILSSHLDSSSSMESLALASSLPNLSLFFTTFLVIYLLSYFIIFRSWIPKLRPEASSCIISLFHGTPAVFLAYRAIFSDPDRNFHSPNTPFQSLVLDYSIAYFLMDLCHYIIFYPSDVLFIGHHLATLFVFITCRFLVLHGAYSLLVLLILAEVTSFCQNLWTLASARRSDSEFADKVYQFLSPPFYALYTVVRGFVGPFFVYQMFVSYLGGDADNVIPRWVWISWIFVVGTAISVSILWVTNHWIDLYRERTGKLEKKIS